jgi:fucose permease
VAFLGARVVLVFTAHLVAPFRLFTGAMVAASALSLTAALVSPPLGFVGLGLCAGVFFPGFYVAASQRMGDDPRVAPSIIAAGLVGGIFGPILLGAVMGTLGERGFFWLVTGIATGTAVAALVVGARLPRRA